MPRNISENGLKFTAAWEKFSPVAYRATAEERYLTIGYGHYSPDVRAGDKISEAQAVELLRDDTETAVGDVARAAHPSLTQGQFDAVCDMVYNTGPGVIAGTTGTGRALRDGDTAALRAKMALFVNQNGRPVLGLRRRVAGRLALFDGATWSEAERIGRAVE